MIETVEFNGQVYPKFQAEGNAAKFAIPFALQVCRGTGYDIGCNRKEWALPGSIPIDPCLNAFHAMKLPFYEYGLVDYIFSSHCLEHVETKWYDVLAYWVENLKPQGTLFLYLPDFSQHYWRPWNNEKHVHVFTPQIINAALNALKLNNVFVSGIDLNNSFMAIGQKS